MEFKEVNRINRCLYCEKSSWCSYSLCGTYAICRRCQHDGAKVKTDVNGSEYFIYFLKREIL